MYIYMAMFIFFHLTWDNDLAVAITRSPETANQDGDACLGCLASFHASSQVCDIYIYINIYI